MPSFAAVALLLVAGPSAVSARRSRGRGGGFLSLSTEMQPQAVAQTLVKVEDEWRSEARAAAECNATDPVAAPGCGLGAPQRFGKSCATILTAVVQASGGDRGIVQEYLDEICAQDSLRGWRSRICQTFSYSVTAAMTADVYENREGMDLKRVCKDFWHGLAEDEKALVQKEREEQEAKEKAEAEKEAQEEKEAAIKAAKEAAEEAERRKEEAEAAAKRRQDDLEAEARRQKEEKEASEAKAAEKAAEKVTQQADERQREVDETLAEAQSAIAETETMQAQANASLASEKSDEDAEPVPQNATAGNATREAQQS